MECLQAVDSSFEKAKSRFDMLRENPTVDAHWALFVCPRDVKKMLVQRDEQEELKEGVWLEPAPALLRKKVEKHRDVARKIFLEGGWTQKRVFEGGRNRKAQALPLPRMVRSQMRDSRSFQEAGAKSKNLEGGEVAKRYC